MVDLSIIIVTYNSEKDIGPCLDSIEQTKGQLSLEVFVVDSASQDNTVGVVRQLYPGVILVTNETNVGFPKANNQVIPSARGRYIMLLNPDTVVRPGALQAIVSFMDENQDCGVCGPMLVDHVGNATSSALPVLTVGGLALDVIGLYRARRRLSARAVKVVSGACLTFRSSLVQAVGLLDEDLFWCEEPDFCLRVRRKGYKISVVEEACVVHYGGHSAITNLSLALERQYMSTLAFFRKHGSPFQFRMACILLLAQAAARYLKWKAILAVCPSKEGQIRVTTFRRLLSRISRLCLYPGECSVSQRADTAPDRG